jgi:hypothetical protein
MSQNDEKTKNKSKNHSKEKNNLDMLNNNNDESYLVSKNQKIKGEGPKKKKGTINYEEVKNDEYFPDPRTRKRSNSVDLYKKQRREREKKNKNNKESNKNVKLNNNNIYEISESSNPITIKKSSKNVKNGKEKRVTFSKKLVTFIDVESYKKFNEENTSKDPFEDMEFLKNLKIDNISNKICVDDEEEDGKARANCSCFIY